MTTEQSDNNLYHYYIYYHYLTEDPSQIRYVGMTTVEPEQRWGKNGIHYKRQSNGDFYNAFQDAGGWDALTHIILEEGDGTKEEIDQREIFWTLFYNANDINNGGYVKSVGCSRAFMADSVKKQISETLKSIPTELRGMSGHHHPEDVKQKIRANNPNCKPVICIETGIIYQSAKEAARQMEIKSDIGTVCNGRKKTAAGYHWAWYKGEDYETRNN